MLRMLLLLLVVSCSAAPTLLGQTISDERIRDELEALLGNLRGATGTESPDEAAAEAQAQAFRDGLTRFLAEWTPRADSLSEGRYALGRAHVLAGNVAEAIPLFEWFVTNRKTSLDREEAYVSLGTAQLDNQRWGDALGTLNGFLQEYPKSDRAFVARFYSSVAHYHLGNVDAAVAGMDQVVASGGESPLVADAQIKAVEMLRDAGRADEARARLAKLRGAGQEGEYLQALEEQLAWIGKAAPELTNIDVWLGGTGETVESLRGRVVVLNFFADRYEACQQELEALVRLARQVEGQGVEFRGVTKYYRALDRTPKDQQRRELESFLAARGVTFPVAVSNGFENLRNYGVRAIPHTVIIGRDGRIEHVKVGASREGSRTVENLARALQRLR